MTHAPSPQPHAVHRGTQPDPAGRMPAPAATGPTEDAPALSPRLRTAQFYLAALGYPVAGRRDPAGATDGVFGANTRSAILRFQADQNLDETGQLDEETWMALGDAYEAGTEVESQAPTTDEADPLLATGTPAGAPLQETCADILTDAPDTDADLEVTVPPPKI